MTVTIGKAVAGFAEPWLDRLRGAQESNLTQQRGAELIGAQLLVAHGFDFAVFFGLDKDHRGFLAGGFVYVQGVLRNIQLDRRARRLAFDIDQERRAACVDVHAGGRTATDEAGFWQIGPGDGVGDGHAGGHRQSSEKEHAHVGRSLDGG